MNLQQKIKKAQSERGFTIVELLIVIVVIGILAAIVIVAYNGVQNSAKSQSANAAASNVNKKIEAYNAAVGSYPTGAANASAFAALLNGQSESKLGDLSIGTPDATNGQKTVGIQYCNAPATATGVQINYWDYKTGALSTSPKKLAFGGPDCTGYAAAL